MLLITTRMKTPVSHISCFFFFITLCSPDGILSPHMSCSASVIKKGGERDSQQRKRALLALERKTPTPTLTFY